MFVILIVCSFCKFLTFIKLSDKTVDMLFCLKISNLFNFPWKAALWPVVFSLVSRILNTNFCYCFTESHTVVAEILHTLEIIGKFLPSEVLYLTTFKLGFFIQCI